MKSILPISMFVFLCGGLMAQDVEFVDSAILDIEAVGLPAIAKESPRLVAPGVQPIRVALPKTVRPADMADGGPVPVGSRQEIGYVRPLESDISPPVVWDKPADGGQVWKVEFRSEDARGLRIRLVNFLGSSGIELRVYEPGGETVRGPYTAPRLADDLSWWTPTIFGEAIGLEFYLPPGVEVPQQMPAPSKVAYLFCDATACHGGFPPGAPWGCHNDVSCSAAWKNNEGRGAAAIYFVSGASCARCSGALLNRGPGDFSPLFMTANHCISTQAEANSVEVFWLYETASCGGAAPDIDDGPRTDGALLLKRNPATDFILLGLYERPGTNFYIGWDPNAWASGDSATGIHHPRGSFKRISFGTSAGSSENVGFDADGDGTADIFVDVWDVSYTNGTTQPGSSGSPIFDGSSRMRGTLTGGQGSCAPVTAYYGRFRDAYTRLKYFLGNADVASPVYADGSVAGDPGQAGSSERGTAGQPFNTVYESTFAVRSGDQVNIQAGNYPETFTVWRPMTLTAQGGTVTIGE